MEQREFHPVAGIFPLLPEDELQALADDIKANGLQVPIIVDDGGNIIDGRNRYLACERAGVEPEYRVSTSDDLVALVASLNVKRRNLSPAQAAIAAAEAWGMVETKRGRPNGNAAKNSRINGNHRDRLGKLFSVSGAYVEQARFVLANDPPGAAAVKLGAKKLSEAYEAAQRRQRETDSIEKQLDRLRAEDPELAQAVVSGDMTMDQAINTVHQRKEEARLRRAGAMRLVQETLHRICPATGNPQPLIDQLWADWSEDEYPEGGPKLTADNLRNAAAVLAELANRVDKGRRK